MVRFAYYAVPAGIQLSAKVFDLTTSTILWSDSLETGFARMKRDCPCMFIANNTNQSVQVLHNNCIFSGNPYTKRSSL